MKIIVGLGNPGPRYETTRHNVGFLAIDRLIEEWKTQGPSYKYDAEVFETNRFGEKILLIKPQTYMNLSGRSVGPLFQFYKCSPSDLIVIHDDLDLKPVTLRFKTGGGTAGHNGLKSIDDCLGKDKTDYHRTRIGIGRPPLLPSGAEAQPVVDYVLEQFTDEELQRLDVILDSLVKGIDLLLQGKATEAMNLYNRKD